MFSNPSNCAGTDTEDWFTDSTIYTNKDMLKKICNSCLAKDECLDYSLHNNVLGYWAGTSELERLRMRKALNIIPQSIVVPEWEMARYYA